MALLCIQCALRALVNGNPIPQFDEDPATHMQRFHSNAIENEIERRALEEKFNELMRLGKIRGFPNFEGGDK